MNITKSAFNKLQFTMLVIVLLCVAGLASYFSMSRAEDPEYIVRKAEVVTSWPGASPERVELLVTDKLERKIQEISEIDYIESESKAGVSIVRVTILDRYKDMKPIWNTLRNKVEDVRLGDVLPQGAGAPIVNDEYGDVYGIVFSIVWDGFNYAQIREVAKDIRDDLLALEDVAKVDFFGIQEERIFVDYNNDKLKEVSLSVDQLKQRLAERNIVKSGGTIYRTKEQIIIEPTGNYVDVNDIRETLVNIPGTNKLIKLKDIAFVYRGYVDPPISLMHTSGHPSVGIAISMRTGGNIITLGEEVDSLLEGYQDRYPIGIEFESIADQPYRVAKKINEFVSNLLQAILIVCAVMLLFLGLRTGFIVASLIPAVILITFVAMSFLNIGLDQISLASLIIALGMLVDNAIVMSESILTQMENGKKPLESAIDSAMELKIPLLISSLTTSAAFLPFYLAKSSTGEYVGALFLVVSITLLVSWFLSLTMIPIFCVFFLKIKKKKGEEKVEKEGFWKKSYAAFLLIILKHKLMTIIVVTGVFALAVYGLEFVPKVFFPGSDKPIFTVEIEMPVDSSIKRSEEAVSKIEQFLVKEFLVNDKRKEGIVNWAVYIGNGGPRYRLQHDPEPPNPFYSFFLVNATSHPEMLKVMKTLDDYIFDNFPDAKPKIRPLEEGTPVDNPIEVRISGKDTEVLYNLSDQVKEKLYQLPGTKTINDDWGLKGKKVVINIDEDRAQRAHISHDDIALSLESAISGVALTEFRENDELIPIILRSDAAREVDLIPSESFNVYSQATGKSVPLKQIADVQVVWEPSIIYRRNRIKSIEVYSDLQEGYTAHEVELQLTPWLEKVSKQWPPGYKWAIGGENEESGKSKRSIYNELPVAGIAILFLLMLQFNCLKRTFIILVTIPLSVIGVVFGLLVMRSYFGIMSILGLISLAGIVINNAIVLLDRIRLEIEENHLSEQEAILTAAKRRMRPILLTTLTTSFGLLPLLLEGGPLWEPMAITIIFGLLVATFLTLGVVPVLYASLFKVKFKLD